MTELENRRLSVDEICKYLGVSKDTIYTWIDKKDMLSHRMGRVWKFKRDHVDHRIESVQASVPMTANGR